MSDMPEETKVTTATQDSWVEICDMQREVIRRATSRAGDWDAEALKMLVDVTVRAMGNARAASGFDSWVEKDRRDNSAM